MTTIDTSKLFTPIVMSVLGALCILGGGLLFFIGKGLWNGQRWARSAFILLCGFAILVVIMLFLFDPVIGVPIFAICTGLGGYMLLSTKVKAAFQ